MSTPEAGTEGNRERTGLARRAAVDEQRRVCDDAIGKCMKDSLVALWRDPEVVSGHDEANPLPRNHRNTTVV